MRLSPLVVTALALLSACGSTSSGGESDLGSLPPDFRAYPLPDVPIGEAPALVIEVTRAFYRDRFGGSGGFSLDWDEELGNLSASPVLAGRRRLTLYMTIKPEGRGSVVDMFALVQTLDEASPGVQRWVAPQKDVYLEEQLYEAILAEHIRRSRG